MTTASATARQSGRTRTAVTAALLAALLAASAWISIPIGAVPITLQVFIVLLAGLLLSPRGALAAVAVYLLLGAIGLPVFAGGLGGVGVLAGPTGGYLWGFALGATAVALARGPLSAAVGRSAGEAVALVGGVAVIYGVGWAQLAATTGMGLAPAFLAGVVPFVPLDLVKAVVALGVAGALRRAGVAS
ncbi:MAG: biotin transporter BioY [Actinomycetota bacterium]|nr:biotin transporter BioY [Actinomycetota bacterium]